MNNCDSHQLGVHSETKILFFAIKCKASSDLNKWFVYLLKVMFKILMKDEAATIGKSLYLSSVKAHI